MTEVMYTEDIQEQDEGSYTWEYITKAEDVPRALQEIKEYLSQVKNPKLALDFETYSPDGVFPKPIKKPDGTYEGYIATFQLGADPEIFDHQWVFDVRKIGYGPLQPIVDLVCEEAILLGHNIKYDFAFLLSQFKRRPKRGRCTMLISQIENAGNKFEHSLGGCYKKAFEFGWFKSQTNKTFAEYDEFKQKMQVSDWTQELSQDQLDYASDDVRLIFWLYRKQLEDLDDFIRKHGKKGIQNIIRLECDLIPEFALIELRGIDFNIEYHKSNVINYLEHKLEEAMIGVGHYFTHEVEKNNGLRGKKREKWMEQEPINIRSPKQVKESLEARGLEPADTTEDELKRLKYELEIDDPTFLALDALIKAKKAASLLSKFGQKMIELTHADGRLHANFFQIGSFSNGIDTGRSSSSEPNVMQIPSRGNVLGDISAMDLFRTAFTVPEGYKIVNADASQIEPRLTAQVTRDPALVMALNQEKADLHALTAKILMGLDAPPEKGTYEREYIGKTANLALSYGIGHKNLAKFMFDNTIDAPVPVKWKEAEAKEKLQRYYEEYSVIKDKMDEMLHKVMEAIKPYQSLASFRNRRPMFVAFTLMGRKREWYLTADQEKEARESNVIVNRLHREYIVETREVLKDKEGKPVLDEDGQKQYYIKKSNWNEYYRTISRIAREAYNFIIQGSCADMLKIAIRNVGQALIAEGYDPIDEGIIWVVHDEIGIRCKKEHVDKVKEILHNCMVEAGQQFIKLVPVVVNVKVGNNWAECK